MEEIKIKCAYTKLATLESLVPNPKNTNNHPEKQIEVLAKIMKARGVRHPIIVSKRTGFIAAGHGRLLAAQMNNMEKYPVDEQDFENEADEYAFLEADNHIARYAEFDEAKMISNLEEMNIELEEFDFEEMGLIDFELPVEKLDGEGQDNAPEVVPDPIAKLGDIWSMGKHRVMCGDSTCLSSVEKLCGGEMVDQLITDPPYNVAYEGKTKDALKIKNDSMDDDSFRGFLSDVFIAADVVMKPGAVFYVWHSDSEGFNFRGGCKDAGWTVRQCLIWNKNSLVMGRQDYHWKHEPCLYGWKDGAGHLWAADRRQTTVLNFDRPSRNDVHPTMKPVDLIQYQVENNTKGGDIVLDLFLGSGTTVIASENCGRRCFGMELDAKYVDVILKRYQEYTGKEAVLESTGEKYNELKAKRDGEEN